PGWPRAAPRLPERQWVQRTPWPTAPSTVSYDDPGRAERAQHDVLEVHVAAQLQIDDAAAAAEVGHFTGEGLQQASIGAQHPGGDRRLDPRCWLAVQQPPLAHQVSRRLHLVGRKHMDEKHVLAAPEQGVDALLLPVRRDKVRVEHML